MSNLRHIRIQRLGKLVSHGLQCKHTKLDQLEQWYHESERVLVAGEAAHLLNVSFDFPLANDRRLTKAILTIL